MFCRLTGPAVAKKEEPGQSSQLLENRPDSFRSKLDADDRHDRTPVGITEDAQCLHLEPVNRGWCQTRDRDRLLDGGCRNRRPLAGHGSVHYPITDEIRLCSPKHRAPPDRSAGSGNVPDRQGTGELPGGILAAFVRPLITSFVVDLPLREQPLAVGLDQFVLVVAEAVEDAFAVRIVVGVVEPV